MSLLSLSLNFAAAADSSNVVEDALKGNVVVVVYLWDSTCADCPTANNIMDDLEDYYGTSIEMLYINLDYGETALVNLYDVAVLPTVVIYDELARYLNDVPFAIVEGIKTYAYYLTKIDGALEYDDDLRSSAETFFDNAELYFSIEDYSKSKYYFEKSKELYDELGDIFNSITCSQNIIKCNKYLEAIDFLAEADDYYEGGNYALAKNSYIAALADYEYLDDDELMQYCNDQIEKCDLYPAADSSYDDAVLLMSAGDYSSAKDILTDVREDYLFLGESEKVSDIDGLLEKCDDYVLASQYYEAGTSAINSKDYQSAIDNYQEAKTIFQQYTDSDKVSLCDQNIAIAQQFLDLQTPTPTTPPPDGISFGVDRKYLYYGGGTLALIILVIAAYAYSSRDGKPPAKKVRKQDRASAMKMASKQLEEETVETVAEDVADTRKEPGIYEGDSFMIFQDKAISIKNSLLVSYVQWLDEFFEDLAKANPKDYFIYRERFDEVYAFFSRTFASDEVYLDQELYDIAKSRLHQIQMKLNDMMDVV